MSSPYAVLNNKPVDQWRVTELREELKRRKLPVKGLKEELVRRLDEALREEMDQVENEEREEEQQYEQEEEQEENTPPYKSNSGEDQNAPPVEETLDGNQTNPITDSEVNNPTVEESAPVEKENTEIAPEKKIESVGDIKMAENSEMTVENDIKVDEPKSEAVLDDNSPNDEEMKPKNEQVSEQVQVQVGTGIGTGTEIKCESISSTESKSISLKKDDNLNTDNFDLEKQQVEVKQDERDDQNKAPSFEEENYKNTPNDNETNNNKTPENAIDGESPEKLNPDRSSGDDSMEEVNYENAPDISSVDGREEGAEAQGDKVKEVKNSEKSPECTDKMDIIPSEDKAPAEKRKLEAEEDAIPSDENVKRQRRWNNDSVKVPERETPTLSQSKDSISPSVGKHAFNRSDSNLSSDSPKERIVPPSQNAATNSLRIDRFLRPFTLKAVQDLLGKTGSVSSFWMDHIKTHCYVTYSSVEEAEATRNAVYNLKWPTNGGNQLIAEFVDPLEVKKRAEAPPPQPSPVSTTPKAVQQPLGRQTRNPQPGKEQLPPPPPLAHNAMRERLLPPPPPLKKTDPTPAVVTLDDLFRKTKTIPRIYYLPCSEEKVAAKLAARAKAAKD